MYALWPFGFGFADHPIIIIVPSNPDEELGGLADVLSGQYLCARMFIHADLKKVLRNQQETDKAALAYTS